MIARPKYQELPPRVDSILSRYLNYLIGISIHIQICHLPLFDQYNVNAVRNQSAGDCKPINLNLNSSIPCFASTSDHSLPSLSSWVVTCIIFTHLFGTDSKSLYFRRMRFHMYSYLTLLSAAFLHPFPSQRYSHSCTPSAFRQDHSVVSLVL